MRLLPICLLALLLSGCGLFGEDFNDLTPGTFRMKADGENLEGVGTFYPNTDLEFSGAQVIMETSRGDRLGISSNLFLEAETGNRITPTANYSPIEGGSYLHEEGTVRIVYADSVRIEGTFRFRMLDRGGPLAVRELTVEGGFNAMVR